jgi:hypothetical protein
MDVNPMSRLWKKLFPNALLCVPTFRVHESGKVGCGPNYWICRKWRHFLNDDVHENQIVKSALWALDLVVCMFAQPFNMINMFPYDDAITT